MRYVEAINTQLDALRLSDKVATMETSQPWEREMIGSFRIERVALKVADPYAWASSTVEAVMAASANIPNSVTFDRNNLDMAPVWWWFEKPLPLRTVDSSTDVSDGVRAILGCWTRHDDDKPSFWCETWVDDLRDLPAASVVPTASFIWEEGETIEQVLQRSGDSYSKMYGPGGRWHEAPQCRDGKELFLHIAEHVSKFLLAGIAWMSQTIVVSSEGAIERHRRKEFTRSTGRKIAAVTIVELRRVRRDPHEEDDKEPSREYSHRWVVNGHWRLAAVGPGRAERRLTWVHPHVKGPEDKPLVVKPRVFVVDR